MGVRVISGQVSAGGIASAVAFGSVGSEASLAVFGIEVIIKNV